MSMYKRIIRMTVAAMLPLAMIGLRYQAEAVAADQSPNPALVTESGPLKGITSPTIHKFLGIPYAAPPVGNRRWTPPQPYGRWHGLFKATELGNACPQLNRLGDEDCLFLNVYTPGLKKNQHKHHGLPVMVWIHGGGLVRGSGDDYDPTPLVEKGNVIVVTINYRLGVLGFFAHPALDAEDHVNANYGLMDQQYALQWVRRNIAAFGGDPQRVTIFGESAGGLSVYANLASPTAAGLFHRAIAQSGAYTSFQNYQQSIVPLAVAEAGGSAFAAQVGCSDGTAQCLRAISATTLVNIQPSEVFPIVDGTVLTQAPGAAFVSGQFNRVPVITGSNRDEWRLYVAGGYDYLGNPLTDAAYPQAVADFVPPSPFKDFFVQLLLLRYPLSNYPPPPGVVSGAPLALGALGTDVVFACSGRNAALLLSQHVPTYAYEFNDANAPLSFGLPPASFPLGSYHGSELSYLFNFATTPAPTLEQRQLSDAMIGYWSQFARTGDPNASSSPVWSPYNAVTDQFQSLVPPTPTVEFNFDAAHQCSSFWNLF
jgi:para-nitrobenzyl esterase